MSVPCVICKQPLRTKSVYYANYALFGGGTGISLCCHECSDAFAQLPEREQRIFLQSRIDLALPAPQTIYAEAHPLTHEKRYIGRTGNLARRHRDHKRSADPEPSPLAPDENGPRTWYSRFNWIYDLQQQGLSPVQEILFNVEPAAYVIEYERRYILHGIQQGWPLLNQETQDEHLVSRVLHTSLDFLHAPFEQLVQDGWFWQEQGIEAFLRAWYGAPVAREPLR